MTGHCTCCLISPARSISECEAVSAAAGSCFMVGANSVSTVTRGAATASLLRNLPRKAVLLLLQPAAAMPVMYPGVSLSRSAHERVSADTTR